MSALIALLVCVAPPISEELAGAPEPALRLEPDVPRGLIPPKWYLDDQLLDTAAASTTLFDASKDGPQGEPVGTACQLGTPASFHLARVELSASLPWRVYSTGDTVYVPRSLRNNPRVAVWRSETHDKDVVGEIILGVITAGLSVLRLSPTYITTLAPPLRGKTRQGSFWVECRTVGQRSVDEALVERQKQRKAPCESLGCLSDEAALLGPDHPAVIAQAQAIVDAGARQAAEWRALASWKHRSFEIVSVTRCGAMCAEVVIKNVSVVPRAPPSFDGGLDALGRPIELRTGFANPIAPGTSRKVRMTVALDFHLEHAATFPIVLRTRDDFWAHLVPGTFTEDGVEYDFQPTGGCNGDYATARVRARKLGDPNKEPDAAWLSNGDSSHLSMPFPSYGKPWVDGEARAYAGSKTCPRITAISARLSDWKYVLLP